MNDKEIYIFVSYSHLNSKWLKSDNELFDLIPFLERSLDLKNVKFWYDKHKENGVEAGDTFKIKIETQINLADIAILLISQEFLNSKFIAEIELSRIQKKYEKGELHVFPILIEPCDWEEIEFISTLQLVPGKPTPLIEFTDNEKDWKQVRYDLLKSLKKKIDKISGIENPPTPKEKTSQLPKRKNKVNKAVILTASLITILILFIFANIFFHFSIKNSQKQDSILQVDNKEQVEIRTIKIGNQIWMADNLNTSAFNNGDPIPEAKTDEDWIKAGENKTPAWCYLNNYSANGKKYGKLYNWYAVNDERGIAPKGYHIPNKAEFELLLSNCGGEGEQAYLSLISSGASGFNALYSRIRLKDGYFLSLISTAGYWSASEGYKGCGASWQLVIDSEKKFAKLLYSHNTMGFSVRCLKGEKLEELNLIDEYR